jgi:hypothetical protein
MAFLVRIDLFLGQRLVRGGRYPPRPRRINDKRGDPVASRRRAARRSPDLEDRPCKIAASAAGPARRVPAR